MEFLVTSATTIPIIGCPTLSELGVRMDCQERILFDEAGNIVRCSVWGVLFQAPRCSAPHVVTGCHSSLGDVVPSSALA